jgi:hypothetical protein
MKPHRGTLVLVMGILGLVVCQPVGIAAWVMGAADLKEMDAGTMDPSGRGTTQAGKICGMIASILMIIGVLIFGLLFALGAISAISHPHQ